MRIVLKSNELWEELETETLSLAEDIKIIDGILSEKCIALVNHFNGNLARENQTCCIGRVKSIIDVLSTKNYYANRRYTDKQITRVEKYKEELSTLLKVLSNEQRALFEQQRLEAIKPKEKEDRLPNINSERAMDMFEDLDKKGL